MLLIGMTSVYYGPNSIIIQSIIFALTLSISLFKKNLSKYFGLLFFFSSSATYINSMLTLRANFDDLTFRSIYLQSYLLGVFQMLLIVLMFRLQFAVLFHFILSVVQCFVSVTIGFEGHKELALEVTMPICISLAIFMVILYLENNERKIYKQLQIYKTHSSVKISQLEPFLLKTMPQSVLLVTETLSEILFKNDSFDKNFNLSNITCFEILGNFVVSKDTLNNQEKIEDLFYENQTIVSLLVLLERALAKSLDILENHLTIYASFLKTPNNLYEVTLFRTKVNEGNGIALLLNDITLQKALISIKASDTSKDRLLATISHELKTPLNGVLGGLNMSLQTAKDEETLSFLNMSKRSAKLAIITVNSFLDLHNIRRNILKLKISQVKLSSVLEEIESLFKSQCAQKGLVLTIQLSPLIPPFIHIDKERLGQILINLLANAIKYTQSGEIIVRINPDDLCERNILFEVIDTGVGIKPEEQANISARMYGNDNEDNAVGSHGIGLGLAVANGLAKLLNKHGQGVKCVSEHKKGSSFSFSIATDLILSSYHKESTEDDLISILENIDDDQDVDLKISQYGERKDTPSRNFEFSKLSLSLTPDLNDQDEFFVSKGSNLCKQSTTFTTRQKAKTYSTLLSPFMCNGKETKRDESKIMSTPNGEIRLVASKTETTVTEKPKGWVLLVDDNPFNLMVARRIVENMGYNVKTAMDGEDAIEKVKMRRHEHNEFFKLILMDCQMPIMDGYEATRELRKLMENKEVPTCPIVALTANDSEEDKKKCKESGMDDVLSKPLQENDIQKIKVYLRYQSFRCRSH